MKLALGTAQFGLNYGIKNTRGKIPEKEVVRILDESRESNIDTIDTAYVYGNSEELIGKYLREKRFSFKVISKLPQCGVKDVRGVVDESIKRLNSSSVYAYLMHDFNAFKRAPEIWDVLSDIKSEGKISKIGFSLYYPHELEFILRKTKFDVIQVPFSVLDRRFEQYFPILKERDVEIHVRSIFLQGLLFMNPDKLDRYFDGIKEKLRLLHEIAARAHESISSVCVQFVQQYPSIDRIVVGVDSVDNLRELIHEAGRVPVSNNVYDDLLALKEDGEDILIPGNWTYKGGLL